MVENSLIKLIKEFTYIKWNWYHLTLNPNLTLEIIQSNIHKPSLAGGSWSWYIITTSKYNLENY